jgi:serine phosphatase RsbU (regulator of sigma subunit)/streptogramin lyase
MEEGGVCSYNIANKEFNVIEGWTYGSITDMLVMDESEIWVGTKRDGLFRIVLDAEQKMWITQFDSDTGLPSNRVNSIFKDRENNIWVASSKGLAIIRNNNISYMRYESGFGLKNIYSLTVDHIGQIWVASQEGLYTFQIDKSGQQHQQKWFDKPEYKAIAFISLYTDSEGIVWAGTYGNGVFRINPRSRQFKNINVSDGLSNPNVIHINGIGDKILFSTLGGGVSMVNMDETGYDFETINMDDGLTSNYIYSVYPVSESEFWIATDGGGPVQYVDGEIKTFDHPLVDSLGKVIYSITKDSRNYLWMMTSNNGLLRYDGTEFEHLCAKNGLNSNNMQAMVADDYGNLLLFQKGNVNIVNDSSMEVTSLNSIADLKDIHPNLNAWTFDGQGNLLVGLQDGILKKKLVRNHFEVLPKLIFIKKQLFYTDIEVDKSDFKYFQNHLTFYFAALWYLGVEDIQYRYKLENYDIDWGMPTTNRMTTYSFLPPGQYEFQFQIQLPNGKWYGNEHSRFSFVIHPPFWQTTWFIIIVAIAVLLLIYLIIVLRTRKLKRDKEMLEHEVRKRTAEIQSQNEEIMAQRDEIERQRDHVTEQKKEIEQQNKHITDSIIYAKRIQDAVLPPEEVFDATLNDYFIFFKPRDIVSGDFYYLNKADNRIIVAAADCTGHGVPGAFMSLLGIAFLNQIVSRLKPGFNAADLLNQLRAEVKKALRQTGKREEAKDGMDISLCVIDADSKKLDFAGAYNPLLVVRNDEEIVYRADRMPIGVHYKGEKPFTNNEVELREGDMLFMYSDGYQDQFGGEDKRKFFSRPFRELLIKNASRSTENQKQLLADTFETWRADHDQIDDVIVLGIRI